RGGDPGHALLPRGPRAILKDRGRDRSVELVAARRRLGSLAEDLVPAAAVRVARDLRWPLGAWRGGRVARRHVAYPRVVGAGPQRHDLARGRLALAERAQLTGLEALIAGAEHMDTPAVGGRRTEQDHVGLRLGRRRGRARFGRSRRGRLRCATLTLGAAHLSFYTPRMVPALSRRA